MQHLSEVAHILRAALDGDEDRVRSYAELLATKLANDGETRQAHILRCILHDIPEPQVLMDRLRAAVKAIEDHRHLGFYDWFGVGELLDAARAVVAGAPCEHGNTTGPNPFDDDSRWTLLSSRFNTPDFIRDGMRDMMRDFINSLPVDDPARLLWAVLPQAPGWEIDLT